MCAVSVAGATDREDPRVAGIETGPIVMTIDQLSRDGATQLADTAMRIVAQEASMRQSQRSANWVRLESRFPALHDDVARVSSAS